jgi:hypothetical protein
MYFDNESELAVLYDYCIYDHRELARAGNAVERLAAHAPPPVGSDERLVLEAALAAKYRVVKVDEPVDGVGAQVTDLLRAESFLLVDRGLAMSARPGQLFATRVIAPDGIHMTTGAVLPISDDDVLLDIRDELGTELGDDADERLGSLTTRERARLSAAIIRVCLAHGTSSGIAYR